MFRYLLFISALLAVRCGNTKFFGAGSSNDDNRSTATQGQNPNSPGANPTGANPTGANPAGPIVPVLNPLSNSQPGTPGSNPSAISNYVINPFNPSNNPNYPSAPNSIGSVNNPNFGNPYGATPVYPNGQPVLPNILSPDRMTYPQNGPNPFGIPNPQINPSDPSIPNAAPITPAANPDIAIINPNHFIFGNNSVYRIGDGQASGTSCAEQVLQNQAAGTRYFFQFEVLTDNTQLTISIGKVCGVDLSLSNFLSIGNIAQGLLGQTRITPAANVPNALNPLVRRTFNKGQYWLVFDSTAKVNPNDRPDVVMADKDDYLIGHIDLTANQPIKPGIVGPTN